MMSHGFNHAVHEGAKAYDRVRGKIGLFGFVKGKIYGFLGIEANVDLLSWSTENNPHTQFPVMNQEFTLRLSVGNKSIGLSGSRNSYNGGLYWTPFNIDPFIMNDVNINPTGGVNTTFGLGLGVGAEVDIEVIQGAQ